MEDSTISHCERESAGGIRILYHGTGHKRVLESVRPAGVYAGQIELTNSEHVAMKSAIQSFEQYDDIAAVLVVDTEKLAPPYKPLWDQGRYTSPGLTLDSFLIVPGIIVLGGRSGYNTDLWLKGLHFWTARIQSLSKNQVLEMNEYLLNAQH